MAGPVRTATFGERSISASAGSNARPWADTTLASSHDSPTAAHANDTDDGAGYTANALEPRRWANTRTMPKKPGSPDDKTHTRRPSATLAATRSTIALS